MCVEGCGVVGMGVDEAVGGGGYWPEEERAICSIGMSVRVAIERVGRVKDVPWR